MLEGHHGAEPELHLQGHVVLLTSREREGNIGCSLGPLGVAGVAGGDDDVLFAVDHVGSGRCVARIREVARPEQSSGVAIEGAQDVIEVGSPNEDKTARCNDGAAIVLRAGVGHAR